MEALIWLEPHEVKTLQAAYLALVTGQDLITEQQFVVETIIEKFLQDMEPVEEF